MKITTFQDTFKRMYRNSTYRVWLWVLGFFTVLITYIRYKGQKGKDRFAVIKDGLRKELDATGMREQLYQEALAQVKRKNEYFKKNVSESEVEKLARAIADKNYEQILQDKAKDQADCADIHEVTMASCYAELITNPLFLLFSVIVSFPMYIVMLLFTNAITKYATDRIVMMIFVLFGVTWLVFTILYISPMDPALNILGQTATQEQVEQFNHVYGLDQSYAVQLMNSFKKLITFNMGNSYQGNENIAQALANKFPITLQVTFWSMLVSLGIAIPAGIISAIKQYSSFDYIAMFIALLGLSIPNFWLGLMLILELAIKMEILPATYQVGNNLTMIMPAIVLGTGMSASVARMTRSSMLEVKNSDYILTARAKGLPENKVVLKHILGNAMIPIVTTIGMQFGGMLGGSSVTEKVFNINGIGSYIVEKQYIPDIPVVLAGVVYISFVVSIVNLIVDILYAVIDPRIKSKMKNY